RADPRLPAAVKGETVSPNEVRVRAKRGPRIVAAPEDARRELLGKHSGRWLRARRSSDRSRCAHECGALRHMASVNTPEDAFASRSLEVDASRRELGVRGRLPRAISFRAKVHR